MPAKARSSVVRPLSRASSSTAVDGSALEKKPVSRRKVLVRKPTNGSSDLLGEASTDEGGVLHSQSPRRGRGARAASVDDDEAPEFPASEFTAAVLPPPPSTAILVASAAPVRAGCSTATYVSEDREKPSVLRSRLPDTVDGGEVRKRITGVRKKRSSTRSVATVGFSAEETDGGVAVEDRPTVDVKRRPTVMSPVINVTPPQPQASTPSLGILVPPSLPSTDTPPVPSTRRRRTRGATGEEPPAGADATDVSSAPTKLMPRKGMPVGPPTGTDEDTMMNCISSELDNVVGVLSQKARTGGVMSVTFSCSSLKSITSEFGDGGAENPNWQKAFKERRPSSAPPLPEEPKASPDTNGMTMLGSAMPLTSSDEDTDAELIVPQTPIVQGLLKRSGNRALTFFDIADGIIDELEKELAARKEEFKYLRECLYAGPEKLHVPSGLQSKERSISNIRKSLAPPSFSTAPSATTWRTPWNRGAMRSLRVSMHNKASVGKANMMPKPSSGPKVRRGRQASVSMGTDRERKSGDSSVSGGDGAGGLTCPWMGAAVPRWPCEVSNDVAMKLEKMLMTDFNYWSFDIFQFSKAANGRPLQFIGYEAFCRGSCFSEFPLQPERACAFFKEVESLYASQETLPFHNNLHASDVTQTVFALLMDIGVSQFFDPMDMMGAILAAVVHDLGHDGRTNGFHVAAHDDLALTYNDKSVLENHHISQAFKLLHQRPECNVLEGLSSDQWQVIRKEMISMVLGTDMAYHFHAVSDFQALVQKNQSDPSLWHEDEKAMDLFRTMVIHAADLSNPAKGLKVAQDWSERCLREFFAQGDEERKLGLPVSPLCDRKTVNVPGSQIGFIEFVVYPAFSGLSLVVPRTEDVCLQGLDVTKKVWQRRKYAYDARAQHGHSEL